MSLLIQNTAFSGSTGLIMTLDQLSKKLRQVRSQMPRVSAEEAYAQMDRLLAAQKNSSTQRLPKGAEKLASGEAKPRSGEA